MKDLTFFKSRMSGADQYYQLHASSNHYKRTYQLSSQECQEHINTVSFTPAPGIVKKTYSLSSQECQKQINIINYFPATAIMRELTNCQLRMPGTDKLY
jgi:hypothetical protein